MAVKQKPQEPMPLLTARAAARYLNVSLTTLSKIEERGLLFPFRTPGGHRRYSLSMLDRYLEASRQWGPGGAPRPASSDGGAESLYSGEAGDRVESSGRQSEETGAV